jgi:pilus assembly protein Flp/PilA
MNIIRNFAMRMASLTSPAFQVEREDGQTLAEYALILALIALVVVGAITLLGGDISNLFESIGSKI